MILFNLRDYFSSPTRAVSSYKPGRLAIEALKIGAKVSYTKQHQKQLQEEETLIYYEHPSSALTDSTGILTPSVGDIFAGIVNFAELDLSGKKLYRHKAAPEYVLAIYDIARLRCPSCNLEKLKTNLEAFAEAPLLETKKENKAIIGDSHCAMYWKPGYDMVDIAGLTLWKALHTDFIQRHAKNYNKVIVSLGEIDNRHHMSNYSSTDVIDLFISLKTVLPDNAYFALLPPQLPDTAAVKKSYWYKNQKFATGDFDKRENFRRVFNEAVIDSNISSFNLLELTNNPLERGIRDIHYRTSYWRHDFR